MVQLHLAIVPTCKKWRLYCTAYHWTECRVRV